jgi:glycosyltransferase involved in cell wall biosynthesis
MTAPGAMRLAFVCPRFSQGSTVGGAEALIKQLALRAAGMGHTVDFLTTCATNHFTWANDLPAGVRATDGLNVHFFPVDGNRDIETFLRVQDRICRGQAVSAGEQDAWLRNNVNSTPLCEHLGRHAAGYDRIVAGPYLFSLVCSAAAVAPDRTFLVPCLHDEPFAYLDCFRRMFASVRGCLHNSEPERDLARRLYALGDDRAFVVGMGIEPFQCDAAAFAQRRNLSSPYLLYAGRREPMKGTPLLVAYFEAFRRRTRRELTLVLAGAGPVNVPPSLGSDVMDVGFLQESEKREAMAGAAAFCHPSLYESLSIVLLETWMAGTPALVHAGSAVMQDQCRRSGGGLWFRCYPEFEEELVRLLDQPGLRDAMGASGRRYVQSEYAWPAVDRRLRTALAI